MKTVNPTFSLLYGVMKTLNPSFYLLWCDENSERDFLKTCYSVMKTVNLTFFYCLNDVMKIVTQIFTCDMV